MTWPLQTIMFHKRQNSPSRYFPLEIKTDKSANCSANHRRAGLKKINVLGPRAVNGLDDAGYGRSGPEKSWTVTSLLPICLAWRSSDKTLSLTVNRQRPCSLTDMYQSSYANVLWFGSQLWEFRFGSRCCTSIHSFLFIFSVLLYVWALSLAVRSRV